MEALNENNVCPTGKLNPFYSADHYFQGDTKDYWTELGKKEEMGKSDAYEASAWVLYQCENLK